jgi:ligand-binding SRPBCC domain-containing protein
MPIITLETQINAPIERVFDLARSIDLHQDSMKESDEVAIVGKTSGLISMGESVTWQATHFGIRQKLTSQITAYDRPSHFRDSMIRGAFRRFDHDHFFAENNGVTAMRDRFDYHSPGGVFGSIFDAAVLENYMRALLEKKNQIVKQTAESEEWKKYVG